MEIMGTSCCGVNEIDGVSTGDPPSELLKEFLQERRYTDRNVFIFVFTDAKTPRQRRMTQGDKFANYIEKNGLGTVVRSAYKLNPNSGNNIAAMIWAIDVDSYDHYVKGNDL